MPRIHRPRVSGSPTWIFNPFCRSGDVQLTGRLAARPNTATSRRSQPEMWCAVGGQDVHIDVGRGRPTLARLLTSGLGWRRQQQQGQAPASGGGAVEAVVRNGSAWASRSGAIHRSSTAGHAISCCWVLLSSWPSRRLPGSARRASRISAAPLHHRHSAPPPPAWRGTATPPGVDRRRSRPPTPGSAPPRPEGRWRRGRRSDGRGRSAPAPGDGPPARPARPFPKPGPPGPAQGARHQQRAAAAGHSAEVAQCRAGDCPTAGWRSPAKDPGRDPVPGQGPVGARQQRPQHLALGPAGGAGAEVSIHGRAASASSVPSAVIQTFALSPGRSVLKASRSSGGPGAAATWTCPVPCPSGWRCPRDDGPRCRAGR